MPLIRYVGFDGGAPVPDPAPTQQPSKETLALRDAQVEALMLRTRLRQVEAALRTCAQVLKPYARPSR